MTRARSTPSVADGTPPSDEPTKRNSPQARRLVEQVAHRHFGEKAKRVVERKGGLTNSVFELKVSQGEFVVRTHRDPTKINDYLKEQWAMEAARGVGVPTPEVLEVGNFPDGRPYMIAQHIQGVDGRASRHRLAVLESLGQVAAVLHDVPTRGFGPVFDWSSNTLSRHETWAEWLAEGFGAERRIALLLKHRVIEPARGTRLRRVAAEIARWRKPAVLQHGDLRLKNALVDPESGRLVAIIDWENAVSLPAPFWDLSLSLHDLGVDEKEAFLAGYGIKPRAYAAALPYLRFFNVLNYADRVDEAAAKKKKDELERFRVRLQGGLDLYDG